MGVTNSKRIYGDEEPDKAQATSEEQAGEAEQPGEETKEEASAGDLDKAEVDKWKPFFKDILKMPEVKDKIKTLILTENAKKDELNEKGITISENDIADFVSGKNEYVGDLILFLGKGAVAEPVEAVATVAEPVSQTGGVDPAAGAEGDSKEAKGAAEGTAEETKEDAPKTTEASADTAAPAPAAEETKEGGLKGKDGKMLKFDQTKATSLSDEKKDINGKPIRNLKEGTQFKAIEKDIVDPMIDAAKIALKHKKFLRVLQGYILDTDSFKNAHKEEEVNPFKEGIKTGETKAADAKEENKEKAEAAAAAESSKGGAPTVGGYVYEGGSEEEEETDEEETDEDNSGGDDYSSYASSSGSSYGEMDGGSIGGDSTLSGGLNVIGFRTAEDKLKNKQKADYKKFKKETRADFKEKTKSFFKDTLAVNKFMDEHEPDLLALMYYGKIPGKWIDKSKNEEKKKVAEDLVKAIIAYQPPGGGEEASAGEDASVAADASAVAPEGGASMEEILNIINQTGGATTATTSAESNPIPKPKQKKKKFTRRKPQHINIRINVGNKNNISDYTDSETDTSSSESDSSSESESDDEDEMENEKEEYKKTKHKRKQTKHKRTRRKNKSQIDYDV